MDYQNNNYVVTAYSLDELQMLFEFIKQTSEKIYHDHTDPAEISQIMWENGSIQKYGDCALTLEYGKATGYCWTDWFKTSAEYNDFIYMSVQEFLTHCGAIFTFNVSDLL